MPNKTILLIWDGNSEMVAHVRSNLGYLIWLRCGIRSRLVTNRIFFLWWSQILRAQHVLNNHLIWAPLIKLYILGKWGLLSREGPNVPGLSYKPAGFQDGRWGVILSKDFGPLSPTEVVENIWSWRKEVRERQRYRERKRQREWREEREKEIER